MKKLIWMACAFSCAILSMLADHTVNGYTYNYEILYSGVQPSGVNIRPIFNSSSHNTASAVSPIPTGDFVIPEYLPYDSTNFLPVMNIGYQPDFGRYAGTAKAFSSPYMTSVVIPDTVTNIDLAAFADCTALISVKLPSNLKTIRQWAFANCAKLTRLDFPSGIVSVGPQSFSGCLLLECASFPEGTKFIGNNAFSSGSALSFGFSGNWGACTNLINVRIPSSVTSKL